MPCGYGRLLAYRRNHSLKGFGEEEKWPRAEKLALVAIAIGAIQTALTAVALLAMVM